MIAFWIVSALFIAVALVFLLTPLLRRARKRAGVEQRAMTVSIYQDELAELDADLTAGTITPEQFEQSRNELQRRMLADVSTEPAAAHSAQPETASGRRAAWVAGLGLPVFAVLLYLQIGNPDALSISRQAAEPPASHAASEITPQQILGMVENLARRLKENPQDAAGWVMLGRSYTALGRFPDAAVAYARATDLAANDAQLWADYADVQAMANGRNLQGKPVELINKALQVDPGNRKALALAGSAAFEMRNYPAAVEYWEKLLKLIPEGSQDYLSVSGGIAEARSLAGGAAAPGKSGAKPATAAQGAISKAVP